jgi:hypothetical protein
MQHTAGMPESETRENQTRPSNSKRLKVGAVEEIKTRSPDLDLFN